MERVEVELQAITARFDAADERWLRQVRELAEGLGKAGVLLQRSVPEAGAKGALDQIVISLGSAGAFTASIEIVKSWLGRDSNRKLIVKFFENGRPQAIELSGRAADEDVFERLRSRLED